MLSSAARRLKGGIDDGYDPFDVFNACQDHVLVAARSHIDRLILEAFNRGVEECEDPASKALLDRLCDLHACVVIEQHRGWYQEHGRISSTRSKAVIRNVNRALRRDPPARGRAGRRAPRPRRACCPSSARTGSRPEVRSRSGGTERDRFERPPNGEPAPMDPTPLSPDPSDELAGLGKPLSLWLDGPELTPPRPALTEDVSAQVCVIGGGITGLTTALLLAREGRSVVLIEREHIGSGSSGANTGKVSSQHGRIYGPITKRYGVEAARTYGRANEAAKELIADLVAEGDGHRLRLPPPRRLPLRGRRAGAQRRRGGGARRQGGRASGRAHRGRAAPVHHAGRAPLHRPGRVPSAALPARARRQARGGRRPDLRAHDRRVGLRSTARRRSRRPAAGSRPTTS